MKTTIVKVLLRAFSTACLLVISILANAELIGVDFCGGRSPANWTSISSSGSYTDLVDESGNGTAIDLKVTSAGAPYSVAASPGTIPDHNNKLAGIDGNNFEFNGTFRATFGDLVPNQAYRIYLSGLRGGANLHQAVTITGGNSISYTQSAGDMQLAINDEVGNVQRELSSYADVVNASSNGTIEVTVAGGGTQGGPFVVAGLALDTVDSAEVSKVKFVDAPTHISEPVVAKQPPTPAPVKSFDFDPDILGIHLGMTLDDARTAVLSLDPPMEHYFSKGDTGAIMGSRLRGVTYRNGFSGIYRGEVQVFGFAPPNAETIASVSREENLVSPIFYKIFRELLVEKYGNPLFELAPAYDKRHGGRLVAGIEHILSWSRKPDGTPITEKNKVKSCLGDRRTQPLSMISRVSEPSIDPFRERWHECGATLIYQFSGRQTPEAMTVHRYNAVLYDLNKIREKNRKTVAFTIVEAKKIEAERLKKAAEATRPVL